MPFEMMARREKVEDKEATRKWRKMHRDIKKKKSSQERAPLANSNQLSPPQDEHQQNAAISSSRIVSQASMAGAEFAGVYMEPQISSMNASFQCNNGSSYGNVLVGCDQEVASFGSSFQQEQQPVPPSFVSVPVVSSNASNQTNMISSVPSWTGMQQDTTNSNPFFWCSQRSFAMPANVPSAISKPDEPMGTMANTCELPSDPLLGMLEPRPLKPEKNAFVQDLLGNTSNSTDTDGDDVLNWLANEYCL